MQMNRNRDFYAFTKRDIANFSIYAIIYQIKICI